IGRVSLRFGANDFGSLMIEENVVSAPGAHFRLTEAEIARNIQDAGFIQSGARCTTRLWGSVLLEHPTPNLPGEPARSTSLASDVSGGRGARASGSRVSS